MINKHQAIVNKAIEQLEKIKTELEKVKDELQEEYDELSFEAQTSEYGDELQTALDSLDAVLWDGLETAEDELNNVASSLELLPTCDCGEEDELYDEDEEEEDEYEDDEEEDDEEEDWDVSASAAKGGLFFGLKTLFDRRDKPSAKQTYDPYDTHWESSFDWKDEDNDGYDDRDDGFWTPGE